MICPHCSVPRKHRERSDRRCNHCRRPFVFEPRDHPSRITDLRVRRAAAWLGEDGRFRYTIGQLAALLARRGDGPSDFRHAMLRRWPEVHGSWPAGLVDEHTPVDADPPAGPVAAHVLCPDRSVAACLLANDVQRRLGVLVRADDPPSGSQPVLLFGDRTDRTYARLAALRGSGRRAVAVGPSGARTARFRAPVTLVRIRPWTLIEWLDLAVRQELRFRDGARRAAAVDVLDWPRR